MTYEIHITVHLPPDSGREKLYNKLAKQEGWKTSRINGDPLLGAGIKFYFTKHVSDDTNNSLCDFHKDAKECAFHDLNIMTDTLRDHRIKILREKIEHIIFDTKTGNGTKLQ